MLDAICLPTRPGHESYTGPERRSTSQQHRWLSRMLDEIDHGMLLVTPFGALRHANQQARDELAQAASLSVSGNEVHAAHRHQNSTFLHALAEAARGRRRLITLGLDHDALSIAVVPLGGEASTADAVVLLVLGRRQGCETLTVDFYARSQGLTSAETRVLQALCDGLRPKDAARRFGVATSTVRTQIASIRAKTQASSIRDLLSKVTTLPPMTPLMRTARRL